MKQDNFPIPVDLPEELGAKISIRAVQTAFQMIDRECFGNTYRKDSEIQGRPVDFSSNKPFLGIILYSQTRCLLCVQIFRVCVPTSYLLTVRTLTSTVTMQPASGFMWIMPRSLLLPSFHSRASSKPTSYFIPTSPSFPQLMDFSKVLKAQ